MKKRVGYVGICLLLVSLVVYACIYYHITRRYFSKHTKTQPFEKLECRNVLHNLTIGRWETSPDVNETDVKKMDDILIKAWIRRQIPVKRWREDGKCGYYK